MLAPGRCPEAKPNVTGAAATSKVRRNDLMPSERPHRCGCMMSSRAASPGGFAEPRKNTPITSSGTATGSEPDEKPRARNGTLASRAAIGTMTRALSIPRRSSRSESLPPARIPATVPAPIATITRVAADWLIP